MSSKLNSEGPASPSESSPPAAHLPNNPAFMCRNRSSSACRLHPPAPAHSRRRLLPPFFSPSTRAEPLHLRPGAARVARVEPGRAR